MPNTDSLSWPNCVTRSVRRAEQHVDQVHGAEALAGAVDAGQQLLRGHRAVAAPAAATGSCRNCRNWRRSASRRNSRAGGCAGSSRVSARPTSASSLPIDTRLNASAPVDSSIMRRCCTMSGQAIGHPGARPACRRGRRGRSPGNRPRCSSADRDGRRSARRACRCPCRTRSVATITMPSSLMKRSWLARARAGVQPGVIGQRGDAGLGQRSRRCPRPWRATGSRRCRRRRHGARR